MTSDRRRNHHSRETNIRSTPPRPLPPSSAARARSGAHTQFAPEDVPVHMALAEEFAIFDKSVVWCLVLPPLRCLVLVKQDTTFGPASLPPLLFLHVSLDARRRHNIIPLVVSRLLVLIGIVDAFRERAARHARHPSFARRSICAQSRPTPLRSARLSSPSCVLWWSSPLSLFSVGSQSPLLAFCALAILLLARARAGTSRRSRGRRRLIISSS